MSLQAITPRLLATLGRGNAEARRAVARALAIDGLARGDDALVDRVVEHRCAVERRGGVAALDLALNARGHASDRHMTRLARRLVDRSPAVRILARAALRAAARAGRRSVPPSPALAELVARMRRRALQGFLRETLQELAERDPQAAAVIEAHARAHPWRAREPYASLRRACEDVLGGSEARPCAICRYLPRSQLYSAARSLPAEFSRLRPVEADAHRLGASAEAPEGTLLRCPECGAYYRHQHVEESIDINWIEVEITVERLLPRRALELLRGAARDAYRAGLEALVAANRRRLRHPRREVRVDATWFITRHELARGELASALTLLADEEEAVRLETLEALLACGARAPEPALTTALRRALGDESAKVRERASRLLVKTCEVESLASLLEHARAEVRGRAAARLRDELAAGRVEPAVALALARPLLHAPESREYEAGLGVLKAVATRPGWTEPAVAALVELAEDPARPDERRIQALYRLSWLVGDGVELTPVVPALAALLEQPALRWAVHDTLRGAQNHGADIGAAAPALTRLLDQPAVSFRGAIAGTLRRWEDEGGCLDAATPTIARGLADPDDDELRYTCVDLIRRRLDRGEYVREAIPPLERCVDDDARYFRETGAELLARVLCGLGEHAALCELLARAGPIVRGGALAGVARELGRGDGSIAESVSDALLDALLEHMDHERRYVREQAETSLRRLAARGPEARARLQARARARGAWTQLATLLGATP
ncbi:MAG: hypothetical protein H6713_27270 [Myxococcales bacterium]|nr:hypothetical protein [Myxococcales bacterium]